MACWPWSASASRVVHGDAIESMPCPDLIAQGQQAMRLSLLETDRQAAQLFEQAAGAAPVHARAWGLLAVARQQMSRHCPIGWSACLAAQPKRWVSLTAPLSACLARSAA